MTTITATKTDELNSMQRDHPGRAGGQLCVIENPILRSVVQAELYEIRRVSMVLAEDLRSGLGALMAIRSLEALFSED